MSWGVSPWVYPVWDSLGFLDLGDYFLPHFGKFSIIISSSIFSWSLFLSSSSRTLMIHMLGCLTLFQRSLRLSSFLLIIFFFFPLFHLFPPFYLLPHLSYLLPPLFYCGSLQSVFGLIYSIIHYILALFLFLLGLC